VRKPKFVLDSYALLAYFQGEKAGEKVRSILKQAFRGDASIYLSIISLGEIYYIIARRKGESKAREVIEDISRLPVELVDATRERVLAAAQVKARFPLSYADAFVVATAKECSSVIVTGDPEFGRTEGMVSLYWL